MSNNFPTRQFPYSKNVPTATNASILSTPPLFKPNTLYQFVLGRDPAPVDALPIPRALTTEEAAALDDSFARLLKSGASHPLTARSLVQALDATGLARRSFVIGEGTQIPWTPETATISRRVRFVVAWSNGTQLAVLLSTAPPFDDSRVFLQVIGWDPTARHFSFYERRQGAWIHAGSSPDALVPPTRGMGPFDSHVNGALVMKELKFPWLHWSSSAAFELPGLAPNDPLRNEQLFRDRSGAEELEQLVRTAIHNWTSSRFDAAIGDNRFEVAPTFLRHLLTSTTINLVSSAQTSNIAPQDGRLHLPQTLFLDTHFLIDDLLIESELGPPSAPWEYYERVVREHGYELRDEEGRLALRGDTHFAFPGFERAQEDRDIVAELLQRRLLSPRIAACLGMVDFSNPVGSPRRAALMRHVPEVSTRGSNGWDLGDRMVASILAAATPGTPEQEFAELWADGDNWRSSFGSRIDSFLKALQDRLDTWEGFESIARLVVSRRREALRRPLLEFRLTLPVATAVSDARLRMTPLANVEEI